MLIFAPPGGSNLQSVYVTRNDYAIVFLWQFPHFMAIAWMYRVDDDRAGYDVLPACETGRSVMVWQIVAPLLLLLPLSVTMPVLVGRAGPWYLATAIVLVAWFARRANQLVVQRSNAMARRLLFASIVYLPLLFTSMMLDQVSAARRARHALDSWVAFLISWPSSTPACPARRSRRRARPRAW